MRSGGSRGCAARRSPGSPCRPWPEASLGRLCLNLTSAAPRTELALRPRLHPCSRALSSPSFLGSAFSSPPPTCLFASAVGAWVGGRRGHPFAPLDFFSLRCASAAVWLSHSTFRTLTDQASHSWRLWCLPWLLFSLVLCTPPLGASSSSSFVGF